MLANSESFQAKCVIIATGYFDNTNRLNVPGEELRHVHHYYTEAFRYSFMNVVVVGGRNSAVEVALELYRNNANVILVHRGSELGSVKYWVLPDIKNRIKEGGIAVHFDSEITSIDTTNVTVSNKKLGMTTTLETDFVLLQIGYRPDEKLLRSTGINLHRRTLIPEFNSQTFETNVKNLYIAGSVVCGCETWNIFIENGRAHAQPIITDIQRRL